MTDTQTDTAAANLDAFANLATGLGRSPDKSTYAYFEELPPLSFDQLNTLYGQNALAARVVDRIVDDATREPFAVKGEDVGYDWSPIRSELEDLDALNAVADTWRWGRLHGSCLLVMAVDDGREYDKPLDLSQVNKLRALQVVEAQHWLPMGYDPTLGSSMCMRPEHYQITLPLAGGRVTNVHRSRVMRIDGTKTPPSRLVSRHHSPSVLDRVRVELARLGQAEGYAATIMHDSTLMVLLVEGLRVGQKGTAASRDAMQAMAEQQRMIMDSLSLLLLDKKDDYKEVTRSFTGLSDLLDQFVAALVRATEMPRSIILGESPGGLNANGDTETRGWFDHVDAQRKQILTVMINRLLTVLTAIRRNRGETVPDEWEIVYPSLWQPTPQEKASALLSEMQALQIGLATRVITLGQAQAELANFGIAQAPAAPAPALEAPAPALEAPGGEADAEGEDPPALPPEPAAAPSKADTPPDLLRVEIAAGKIGLATRTLTLMMQRGELPYWQFGQHRFVSESQVMAAGSRVVNSPEAAADRAAERKETQDMIARAGSGR